MRKKKKRKVELDNTRKKKITICLYWNSSLFLLFSFLIFKKKVRVVFFFCVCVCDLYSTYVLISSLNAYSSGYTKSPSTSNNKRKKRNLHLLLSQVPQLWLPSFLFFFKEDLHVYLYNTHK